MLKTGEASLSRRVDTTYYPKTWNVDPNLKPDVFDVVVKSQSVRVAFISDIDSIVYTVKAGDTFNFVVMTSRGDSAYTQIRGLQFIEPAQFSTAYIKANRNKTLVEIPAVYELINTVFALTEAAKKNSDLIRNDTPYYDQLASYFAPWQSEPIVSTADSMLNSEIWSYFNLKMDSYAFVFDKDGTIQQSPVYDHVSWGRANTLQPYLAQLQQFATKSKFLSFYQQHQPYYNQLIQTYRDSLDVLAMQSWLNKNFPSTHYDAFKIIFSPLVNRNQSAVWFDNNGFREAQAHVNFPFPDSSDAEYSKKAVNVRNGNIVFTELNHAFINPEAGKPNYQQALATAFSNLDTWLEAGKPAKQSYNDVYSCFNEYMNWGLVGLRYVDYAPKDERDRLLGRIEKIMTERRGFKRFAEFNQFLVLLYQNRPAGATVADLYPQIIEWFNTHK